MFVLVFLADEGVMEVDDVVVVVPRSVPEFSGVPLVLLSLLAGKFRGVCSSFRFVLKVVFGFGFAFIVFLSIGLSSNARSAFRFFFRALVCYVLDEARFTLLYYF